MIVIPTLIAGLIVAVIGFGAVYFERHPIQPREQKPNHATRGTERRQRVG